MENQKKFVENELADMAQRMKRKVLDMAYHAGKNGAHLGGALSCIEILAVLYGSVAGVQAQNPCAESRDKVLIGKAHCVLAYYTALYEAGFISEEDLDSFEKNGSDFVGHPLKNIEKGIEYAGGSLGMALSVACGMAYRAKHKGSRVYVLLGDGECQEGSVWEAMMFAANYELDNLVIIIDNNGIQSDGTTAEVAGMRDLKGKFHEFGGEVVEVDGHDINALKEAFGTEHARKPLVLIAHTIKGKGVSFMENQASWHHSVLNEEQYHKAKSEIEGI